MRLGAVRGRGARDRHAACSANSGIEEVEPRGGEREQLAAQLHRQEPVGQEPVGRHVAETPVGIEAVAGREHGLVGLGSRSG